MASTAPDSSSKQNQNQIRTNDPESRRVRKYRVRTRRACDPCRRRKKKCDGKDPCDICIGYGYKCCYTRPDEKRNSPEYVQPLKSNGSDNESFFRGIQHAASTVTTTSNSTFSTIPGPLASNASSSVVPGSSNVVHSRPPMLEPFKCRFMAATSAVAFPRSLAMDLKAKTSLRLHSFAWNACQRAERTPIVNRDVRNYITLDSVMEFARIYFEVIHPIYGFMDPADFYERASAYWASSTAESVERISFEAVVAGVVALGSFFSPNPLSNEHVLVEHAKQVLDLGISYPPSELSNNQAMGWLLRTLYLRLTTRPHLAWLASCLTMHVVEALGLHRELETLDLTVRGFPPLDARGLDKRRRLFWCAWAVNIINAAETGRSPVHIHNWDCQMVEARPNDETVYLVELARIVSDMEYFVPNPSGALSIHNAFLRIKALPDNHAAFTLLKADVAIHCFRLQRIREQHLSKQEEGMLLDFLRRAFTEGLALAHRRQPWWNVISTNFQGICVLLALDSSDSIAMVPNALTTLEQAVQVFDSHLTREALRTAMMLTETMRQRKQDQFTSLQCVTDETMRQIAKSPSPSPATQAYQESVGADTDQGLSLFEFSTDDNSVWAQFFDAETILGSNASVDMGGMFK